MGAHGAALTGGQRQRLALARALLAERGTHAQLIRAGGTYRRLWEASR